MTPEELAILAEFGEAYPRLACSLLLAKLGHAVPQCAIDQALQALKGLMESPGKVSDGDDVIWEGPLSP